MRMRLKRLVVAALMVIVPALVGPSIAAAVDAQLYELTENMRMVDGRAVSSRRATSQLMGWANVGTPLCPATLIQGLAAAGLIPAETTQCWINATGRDVINLETGRGPFRGSYSVVIQGDNMVDGAEFVVSSGTFKGKMDFSPAILMGVPYGTVVGALFADGALVGVPFTGTFRLPFVLPAGEGYTPALYLTDEGGVVPVDGTEYSLGVPTVRFEITF
jgi:hypothetical protein